MPRVWEIAVLSAIAASLTSCERPQPATLSQNDNAQIQAAVQEAKHAATDAKQAAAEARQALSDSQKALEDTRKTADEVNRVRARMLEK